MNLIDPKGLFDGERLAACSDLARLHWPWLYLGANGHARLELSYPAITSSIYRSFKKAPTEDQLWGLFEEFASNFLVILYQANGSWWAQFVTSEKWLPRYKTSRDQSSPAPPHELVERQQKGYIAWKSGKSLLNQRFQKFSETSGNVPQISAAVAVAVAGAVAGAEKPSRAKPARVADPRHQEFKAAILSYWRSKNPGEEMPWDGSEARALSSFLKACPAITTERIALLLENRAESKVNHGDRPRLWIENMMSYGNGPIDRFGKPIGVADDGQHYISPAKRRVSAGVAAFEAAGAAIRAARAIDDASLANGQALPASGSKSASDAKVERAVGQWDLALERRRADRVAG